MRKDDESSLNRRDFLKFLVAAGGGVALLGSGGCNFPTEPLPDAKAETNPWMEYFVNEVIKNLPSQNYLNLISFTTETYIKQNFDTLTLSPEAVWSEREIPLSWEDTERYSEVIDDYVRNKLPTLAGNFDLEPMNNAWEEIRSDRIVLRTASFRQEFSKEKQLQSEIAIARIAESDSQKSELVVNRNHFYLESGLMTLGLVTSAYRELEDVHFMNEMRGAYRRLLTGDKDLETPQQFWDTMNSAEIGRLREAWKAWCSGGLNAIINKVDSKLLYYNKQSSRSIINYDAGIAADYIDFVTSPKTKDESWHSKEWIRIIGI